MLEYVVLNYIGHTVPLRFLKWSTNRIVTHWPDGRLFPAEVLDTLQKVIKARQKCTEHYKAVNDPGEKEDTWSHEHFTQILQEIYSSLKEFYDGRETDRKGDEKMRIQQQKPGCSLADGGTDSSPPRTSDSLSDDNDNVSPVERAHPVASSLHSLDSEVTMRPMSESEEQRILRHESKERKPAEKYEERSCYVDDSGTLAISDERSDGPVKLLELDADQESDSDDGDTMLVTPTTDTKGSEQKRKEVNEDKPKDAENPDDMQNIFNQSFKYTSVPYWEAGTTAM